MKILKIISITIGLLTLSVILFMLCIGSMLLTGSLDKLVPLTSLHACGIFMLFACIGLAITVALLVASTVAIVDAISYPWRRSNLLWDCWKAKAFPEFGLD